LLRFFFAPPPRVFSAIGDFVDTAKVGDALVFHVGSSKRWLRFFLVCNRVNRAVICYTRTNSLFGAGMNSRLRWYELASTHATFRAGRHELAPT
jgi:hypothetical protein